MGSLHSPVSQRISRPVAMLSFAFNWYVGSDNVVGYHIVNLSIHLLTAFFLYLTIFNLLNAPNLKSIYQKSACFIALLAAVLWAIHPIQTQAVTYIVQTDGKHGRYVLRIRPLLLHKGQAGIIKKVQDPIVFGLRIELSARAWIKRKYGHISDCTGLD